MEMNRRSRDEYQRVSTLQISSDTNLSFIFLVQHEDPEVGRELLELSIERTVTKTRSEIFTNVKTGKSATRKTRGRQPLPRYVHRRCIRSARLAKD
jgi:hypothetical protein